MRRIQKWAVVLGAALVLGPACHGQPAAGAVRRGPAGPEFIVPSKTIIGMVRDPAGKPAPGLPVTFYGGWGYGAPDYAETKSDDNGRYVIVLNPQQAEDRDDKAGPPPFMFGPPIPTNCLMVRDLGRNLVAFQEFTGMPSNMDLNMKEGIRLSGSVKNSAGAPLSNIALNVLFTAGLSEIRFMPRPDKTDARGAFSIPALPQGHYYNTDVITAPGYGSAHAELREKDSKTNRYVFPTFVLKPADRKLAGHVLGQDGKPVAGAKVEFEGNGQPDSSGEPEEGLETDAQGHFHFDAVCEGRIIVSVNYANSWGNVAAHGGDTNVVLRVGIINVIQSEEDEDPLE